MNRTTLKIGMTMAALALSACVPADIDTDTRFLIYDLDSRSGEYQLRRVTIPTLENVQAVDGDVAYLRGGGKMVTPESNPQTEQEWQNALAIEDTNTPRVEYTIDDDGTVIPWDFDSAMMLTVYHHLEEAQQYFDTVEEGLGTQKVGRIPCYYYPQLSVLGISLPLFVDNAAYAPTMNAFLVPPRLLLTSGVPLYANQGVMIHEYSHAVFNRVVHSDQASHVPRYLIDDWPNRPLNELGGLDEGMADIFAGLATEDSDFISASIDGDLIDRNMDKERFYEPYLLDAIRTGTYPSSAPDDLAGGEYSPHDLGAVVASIIWTFRGELDDDQLAAITLKTLYDIANPTDEFRVTQFFDAFHDNLPTAMQSDACTLFQTRLPAVSDELLCVP